MLIFQIIWWWSNKSSIDSTNAGFSFKYFGTAKGVSVYTFIDESHKLFYSTVINVSERESGYVIDGLMHNDVVKSDIDKSGKKVISKEFEDAGNFTGEYAVAKKDGKVGVIDKNGNWIIEPDFEEISLDEDMVIFKVSESYFMLPFEEIKK